MKKLLCLSALIVYVSACRPSSATKPSGPIATPYPTYTSYPTYTPYPTCLPTPTATPLPESLLDFTIYLWNTKYPDDYVILYGERVELGTIYTEGAYVRGEVRVPIADWVSGRPSIAQQHLPDPYRLEVKFSESLVAATKDEAEFGPQDGRFSMGRLNCDSATPPDKPYTIEITLYDGEEAKKRTVISFHVADDPLCGTGREMKATPGEGLIVSPTDTPAPEFLYSAPVLLGPADESEFRADETILLVWDTRTPLSEDEWYEVQLWREGGVPYRVVQWVKEGTWKVERRYYPGRYQWRVLIVRGQEGHKEMPLSPPSQTWDFSWLRPSTPVPTAPTSPAVTEAPVSIVDLTVYLRGTNNAQGFAAFSGEHVDAGPVYNEGGIVFGSVAVQIGDKVYHYDEDLASGELEPLPAPYRLEVEFSKSLIAATESMEPGSDPQKAQFWVGTLDCDSATPPGKPYTIKLILYAGEEARKYMLITFYVTDDPLCGAEGEEPEEGGGGGEKPPVRP